MLVICRNVVLLLLGLFSVCSAFALEGEDYTQETERATRLLNKAVTTYKANGDAAFALFSRQGEFTDGDLYVYVVDTSGLLLASGGPSVNLVGRNVNSIIGDAIKGALTLQAGEVHVAEYRWMNWNDGKEERKRVFYQRDGERIFAVGYYMPRSSKDEAVKLLERASTAIALGAAKTIERINALDGEFIHDDLYVFVVDLATEKFVAHGYNLRLVGSDFRSLQSSDKKPIGKLILDQIKNKDEGEVEYLWLNPANGRLELKNALIRKVGNYAVIVGYYQRPKT